MGKESLTGINWRGNRTLTLVRDSQQPKVIPAEVRRETWEMLRGSLQEIWKWKKTIMAPNKGANGMQIRRCYLCGKLTVRRC